MVKFSVIIPVYNGENTLVKCVDSIINQTFSSYEIIIINDGSIDNTHEICKKYVKKYNNIIYISQNNSGPSVSRNKGLDIAQGEYGIFVDADDYINEKMLEIINEEIIRTKADTIFFGFNVIKNGIIVESNLVPSKIYNSNEVERCVYDLTINDIFGYQCSKVYNLNIIKKNSIRMKKELSLCEDLIFTCEYIKYSKLISVIGLALYNYVKYDTDTLSTKVRSDLLEINLYIFNYLKQYYLDIQMKNERQKKILFNRCTLGIVSSLKNLYFFNDDKREKIVKEILSSTMYEFFKEEYYSQKKYIIGKRRFIFKLMYFCPNKVLEYLLLLLF